MKFSQYNLLVENNQGGITIYNVGNSKYVKINKEEDKQNFLEYYEGKKNLSSNDPMIKALYERGYIVDKDFNEYYVMKTRVQEHYEAEKKHLDLTLYVTNQCNFRCIYCPQEHETKIFSDTKWEALYKYLTNSIEQGLYEQISLSFFGGEPLLEANKIIRFLEKLKDFTKDYPKITFNHQITTNGYLLLPDVYDKLTSLGVKQYQITLDGFAESHNKMRPLVNGNPTWDRVVENLEYINKIDDEVYVSLRTNYNNMNLSRMEEFNVWLRQTFDNKKIFFMLYPVSKFSYTIDDSLLAENFSEEEKNIAQELNDFNDERNSWTKDPYLAFLRATCKSSNPSYFTLQTDGRISKCENLSDSFDELYIGYLSDDGDFIFNERYQDWIDGFELDDCETCLYYPTCAARTCPAKKVFANVERKDCFLDDAGTIQRMEDYVKNL